MFRALISNCHLLLVGAEYLGDGACEGESNKRTLLGFISSSMKKSA